jgi:urease accessory protein
MEDNFGTQIINIVQEEGTYLEYIPDQVIPYANSKFYQVVNLNIHDNATMIYSELLAPGRVASGESFQYDICYIKTIARNQAGKLRFTDVVKLEPNTENLRQVGMFGTFKVLSTVYIITPPVYVRDIQDKINELIDRTQETVFGGSSILPRNQGLIIRLLGKGLEELRNLIFQIVAISRMRIMGASFTRIRKP